MTEPKDASVSFRVPNAVQEGAPLEHPDSFNGRAQLLARVAESDAGTAIPTYATPAFERPDVTEAKARLRDALLYYEKTPKRDGSMPEWGVVRVTDLRTILIAAGVDLPDHA